MSDPQPTGQVVLVAGAAGGIGAAVARLLAQEVIDLLVRGASGEIRLRRSAQTAAVSIAEPSLP